MTVARETVTLKLGNFKSANDTKQDIKNKDYCNRLCYKSYVIMCWTGLTWKDYKESLTAGGISCIKKAVVDWIREIFLSKWVE